MVHTTPRYMAARFAFYDDRLDEAWTAFLGLLSQVEPGPGRTPCTCSAAWSRSAYAGAGAARRWSTPPGRSRVAERFDLDAARQLVHQRRRGAGRGRPGPGPDARRAGGGGCEERGDIRYLQRHLLVLGQASLRLGEAGRVPPRSRRVRDASSARTASATRPSTAGRPSWSPRWWPPVTSTAAADVVAESWAALEGRAGAAGARAQLQRAEASLHTALGDHDRAIAPARPSRETFGRLGMQVDLGRSLLGRGYVERRRRRLAASRAALVAAYDLFQEISRCRGCAGAGALDPARTEPAGSGRPAALLTDTEARVAARGRRGREQPGDRRAALPLREDRRGDADPDLPQAGGPVADPARRGC